MPAAPPANLRRIESSSNFLKATVLLCAGDSMSLWEPPPAERAEDVVAAVRAAKGPRLLDGRAPTQLGMRAVSQFQPSTNIWAAFGDCATISAPPQSTFEAPDESGGCRTATYHDFDS